MKWYLIILTVLLLLSEFSTYGTITVEFVFKFIFWWVVGLAVSGVVRLFRHMGKGYAEQMWPEEEVDKTE